MNSFERGFEWCLGALRGGALTVEEIEANIDPQGFDYNDFDRGAQRALEVWTKQTRETKHE